MRPDEKLFIKEEFGGRYPDFTEEEEKRWLEIIQALRKISADGAKHGGGLSHLELIVLLIKKGVL